MLPSYRNQNSLLSKLMKYGVYFVKIISKKVLVDYAIIDKNFTYLSPSPKNGNKTQTLEFP
jgi:hypothetical protein